MNGNLTTISLILIAFLPDRLISVMLCEELVVPTVTFPNSSPKLSLLLGLAWISSSGAPFDCANAGRANAAIRNSNEKLKHAADRVNDLLKRIDNSLPKQTA
ncbi:hypothetical protein [Candidatus Binatus sp.]|uniref:hypothetical protein n=1 Tax=Candidatus Binatus sp. TaxID=2811406 RepID=UPI002F92F52B